MSGPFGSAQLMYNPGFYPELIDQSLRFDGTSYLSRTPSVAGNRKTWTFSTWFKRSKLDTLNNATIFSSVGGSAEDMIRFIGTAGSPATYKINFYIYDGAYIAGNFATTQVFRDPSAWMHLVWVWDTTNATSTDRIRLYINGERITAWDSSTYPSLNAQSGGINNTNPHQIGNQIGQTRYFDGYMADTYFVDGTALDPTSFGEFKNGVWIPKAYTGSYGTNGFHLTYQDDTVSEGFNTVTWNGNASTQAISGVGFSPDLVWIKAREIAYNHRINDSIRGPNKILYSDLTNSEFTDTDQFYSFDNDGFTLGPDAGAVNVAMLNP